MTQSTSLSNKLEMLLELYDEGQLPPEEQVQLAQELIDLDLDDDLRQYQQFCDSVSYTHLTLPTILRV